jgi:cytochrome b involved in lipid metabolism
MSGIGVLSSPIYDYLIAGGGIAGLYTAYHLVKQFPTAKICILEASNRLGGRLHSIHLESNSIIEAGGARFNTQQYRILALIRALGLDSKCIEIPSNSKYISIHPNYDPRLETIFPEIDDIIYKLQAHIRQHKISDDKLINTNLLELVHQIYSHQYPTIKKYLISRYPYYSELHSLNALEGLSLFTNEFSAKMKYFILAGGLEQLTTSIYQQLKKHSTVDIHLNQPLETLETINRTTVSNSIYTIISRGQRDIELRANKIILALPQSALLKIKYLTRHAVVRSLLNSIQPEPLYRIYARYPLDKKTGKVWFAEMPKIISNLPIKYIIPSNVEQGIIMISYTDSRFARYWFDKLSAGDDILEKELARQLKLLFPKLEIPAPMWIKHYYWDMGAGYWKPGCSRETLLPQITQPLAGEEVYICNENYSSHQAWVEGSLESAEYVLEKLGVQVSKPKPHTTPNKKTKHRGKQQGKQRGKQQVPRGGGGGASKEKTKTKKWKTYTLEEVAKHKSKSDAWIAIHGKVADITKWIPIHPGGDVIMKGVGRDATKLFTSIGHDEYARKMLQKYQIGILQSQN